MQNLSFFSSLVLPWLPPFAVVALSNLGIALFGRPLGRARWPLALLVALAPTLVPKNAAYSAPWGVLTTVLTTFVIVTAARLPDWDSFARGQRSFGERYVWLTFPMARRASDQPLPVRKTLAFPLVRRGLFKILCWQALFWIGQHVAIAELPWPIRSALLVFFFVLNLTATSDLLSALCLLLGYDVDPLFESPLTARSPRDFWSRRWNRFISRFALKHVALKIRKGRSELTLIAAVFGVSGVFHEYFAWSVGGHDAGHGYMTLFFLIQGLMVWLGVRLPLRVSSPLLSNCLTWAWMVLTAPLFFRAVVPALLSFQYPADWLPF